MTLSDRDITYFYEHKGLGIVPFEDRRLQPASYDIRLGDTVLTPIGLEDWLQRPLPYVLMPGEFVLGVTLERVVIPPALVARIEGRSSVGRRGLLVHVTAGFVDPGFAGHLTLELCNIHPTTSIALLPGMEIAQLSFETLSSAPRRLYGDPELGSRYQNQPALPVPARTRAPR